MTTDENKKSSLVLQDEENADLDINNSTNQSLDDSQPHCKKKNNLTSNTVQLNEDKKIYHAKSNVRKNWKKKNHGCPIFTEVFMQDLFLNDSQHCLSYANGETIPLKVAGPEYSADKKNDVIANFFMGTAEEGDLIPFEDFDIIVYLMLCSMPEVCEPKEGENPKFALKDLGRRLGFAGESLRDLKWLSDSIFRLDKRWISRDLENWGDSYNPTKTEMELTKSENFVRLLPIRSFNAERTSDGIIPKFYELYEIPTLWKITDERGRIFRIKKQDVINDLLKKYTPELFRMKLTILTGLAWKKRQTIKLSNFYTKEVPISENPTNEEIDNVNRINKDKAKNAKKRVDRYLNKLIKWKAIKSYEWILNKENELTLKCNGVSL